jgi:acetyltransferase-like isoleucine patch superfamily enzyme
VTYHPDPWQELFSALPSWPGVVRTRTYLLRRRLAECGRDVVLAQGVMLRYPEKISFGNTVFLNRGTTITARAPITIGSDVLIGPGVVIDSGDHVFRDPAKPINSQGYARQPIIIGSDIWIGAHAIILKGVTLGQGCVVAAGAVVTKSVAPFTVVGGVPARVISGRGHEPDRQDEVGREGTPS